MVSSRSIRAGAAYVELTVNNSKLLAGLKSAQAKLKAFSAGVRETGMGLLKASSLATASLALSAKTFGSFRDQMAIVQAVTNASDKDFAKLTDRAKDLGRTTSFTASEVASAMVALGRAGFTTAEILSSIAGTLDLARAGAIDLGEATTIMADVSRSFGLTADEAGRVGDVLAKTANIANTDVKLVGESMKYVASSANLSGQSLERMSGALAVLANRGLKGEMAGASMAMALSQLSGEDVQQELTVMGVAVTDAEGNMRDLIDILRDLGKATSGMGNAQKLATFKKFFDQRGMRSMILLSENVDEWEKLTGVVQNSSGTASAVAKKMDDTLGGSFRMLMSAVEGVQIAIGEALDQTLRNWMDRLTEVAGVITSIIEANRGFVVSALKIIAVVGGVGAVLVAVGSAGSALAFAVGGVASILSGASAVVGTLGTALAGLLSPIGLVAAAIAGLGVYILHSTGAGAKALIWLGERFGALQAKAETVLGAIRDALAAGDITLAAKVLWLALRVEWDKGLNYLNTLWETLYVTAADVFDRIATSAVDVFDTIYIAVRNAVDGIYKLILGVGEFIAKTFWTAVQSVVESFAYVLDKIMTAGYALHLIDDKELVKLDQSLKSMKKGAKGFTDAQKQEAESFYQSNISEANQRQQQRSDELNGRTIDREQGYAERTQSRDQAYTADLTASEEALRQARAEWEAAVTEAKQKRESAETGVLDDEDKTSGFLDDLRKRLGEAGQAALESAQKISVQGTFNPAALLSLQGSSTAERTAKAAEDTAKNTKTLVNESKLGGLKFT